MRTRVRPDSSIDIRDITDMDTAHGRQVLTIYEQSFPEDERETPEEIAAGLEDANPDTSTHLRAVISDDRVAGFAYYSSYARHHLGYLKYIAVDPGARGTGLGSALLGDTVRQVRTDGRLVCGWPHLGLVLEVERPELARSEEERTLRDRRIAFYRRNGASMIDRTDFIAPPVGEGKPSIPFHLLVIPAVHKYRMHRWLKPNAVTALLIDGYEESADSWYLQHALARTNPRPETYPEVVDLLTSLSLARIGLPDHRRRRG